MGTDGDVSPIQDVSVGQPTALFQIDKKFMDIFFMVRDPDDFDDPSCPGTGVKFTFVDEMDRNFM